MSAHSKEPDSLLIHFWLGGDITMKELAETMDYLSATFPDSHLLLKQIVSPKFLGKSACMLLAIPSRRATVKDYHRPRRTL